MLWDLGGNGNLACLAPPGGAINRAPTIDIILTLEFRRAWRG